MKIIDCEFHYYLPELMDYLATRDNMEQVPVPCSTRSLMA